LRSLLSSSKFSLLTLSLLLSSPPFLFLSLSLPSFSVSSLSPYPAEFLVAPLVSGLILEFTPSWILGFVLKVGLAFGFDFHLWFVRGSKTLQACVALCLVGVVSSTSASAFDIGNSFEYFNRSKDNRESNRRAFGIRYLVVQSFSPCPAYTALSNH
jgi:hypothetical protein